VLYGAIGEKVLEDIYFLLGGDQPAPGFLPSISLLGGGRWGDPNDIEDVVRALGRLERILGEVWGIGMRQASRVDTTDPRCIADSPFGLTALVEAYRASLSLTAIKALVVEIFRGHAESMQLARQQPYASHPSLARLVLLASSQAVPILLRRDEVNAWCDACAIASTGGGCGVGTSDGDASGSDESGGEESDGEESDSGESDDEESDGGESDGDESDGGESYAEASDEAAL